MSPTLDLRCAVQTAALGESPAGTASVASRWVLLELPGPWPKPALAHPLLETLPDPLQLTRPGVRTLLVADDDTATGVHEVGHRITVWDHEPDTPLTGLRGRTTTVPTRDVAAAALAATDGALDADLVDLPDDRIDIAICTQGSHDRCCGSMGTRLHAEAAAHFADRPDVHLWRTSHTGGHRFAPTGLSFPDAMTWAGLDLSALRRLVDGDVDELCRSPLLRGNAAIVDKAAQLLDLEGLRRHGADWWDAPRTWTTCDEDTTVTARLPDGDVTYRGVLGAGRTLPVPPCGSPLEESVKTRTEAVLVDVVRV